MLLNYAISVVFSARQRSCGKVIFSFVCLCPRGFEGGLPISPLPVMHWTSPYRKPPLKRAPVPAPLYSDTPPLKSSLYKGPPPQTCSNLIRLDLTVQGPPPTCSHLFVMKHVWSASRSWHPTRMLTC